MLSRSQLGLRTGVLDPVPQRVIALVLVGKRWRGRQPEAAEHQGEEEGPRSEAGTEAHIDMILL